MKLTAAARPAALRTSPHCSCVAAASPVHLQQQQAPARKLLGAEGNGADAVRKSRYAVAATNTTTTSGPRTCCMCKCVNPAKDMRSEQCKRTPGCVGMAAPTFGQTQICQAGANLACDKVCVRDMGTWFASYEC